jgi:hypothetical protein
VAATAKPEGAAAPGEAGILELWLKQVAQTYPQQTVEHLLGDRDQFHNPVGHELRTVLPALLAAVMEGKPPDEAAPFLERWVRIGAVQNTPASHAVSLLFLLKPILRDRFSGGEIRTLEDRIDSLALVAFDAFTRCREDVRQIQINEARRRTYVQDRVAVKGREA